ncbi:RdRP-domain-containing protein [Tothia fuscella]|uniref:RNA-dependent RNA polymerase n=1 Tax=Tothia fuscella TaxID=1048955 RepID=A0A9P4U468_9PEZI|nr:RdRP-domain-containing protein [Tothia fuscella]
MMVMGTVTPAPDTRAELVLNLARKQIDVKFPLPIQKQDPSQQPEIDSYRFQIPLSKLNRIYVTQPSRSYRVMVIPLDAPPEFYRRTKDIQATHDSSAQNWSDWQTWFRQTDIVLDQQRLQNTPIRFRKDDAIVDIGRWTTYRLVFNDAIASMASFDQICAALQDHNVQIITDTQADEFQVVDREPTKLWKFLDSGEDDETPSADTLSLLLEMDQGIKYLPFEVRYQLEVCLSNGYLNEHNITEEFLRTLTSLEDSRAIDILERVADLKKRFFNPMEIFTLRKTRSSARKKIPDYCTLARSAVVTPTMVYYSTPAIEISNRVIRHWSDLSDRFIRVRFTDEVNNGRINSREDSSQDEIFNRITRAMKNGIIMGDHRYEFLACGNSQFREHGAYFFAPTPQVDTEYLRACLGDLQNSPDRFIPAKWFARLGQNFSTTRGISTHVFVKSQILTDIYRIVEGKKYCFSDGVGKISPQLARLIAEEFGLLTQDPPSVFQFRLGGCKGVLAVSPEVPNQELWIRPSQYKFAAIHQGLEIIRSSSYVGAVLNRQIIVVLSALGVSDSVFRGKMEDQLRDLELAMTNEKVALRELQKSVDMNQTTLTIAGLVLEGFMRTQDPFTISLLKLWRSWSIKYLKEKAKIPIEQGACLLGCVDETATLRGHYDNPQPPPDATFEERLPYLPQVFCYVDRERKGIYDPIEGICILARNPSLHPGDIRVVYAVDVPALHHLKNVVVLPQTGDRDLGNMCSGGDLDGDDYLLIWDQDLIPRKWDHPAMDFTPTPPRRLDRVTTVDDMTDFFVTYMKNDCLPTIAHAHLAFADYLDDGVKDEKCLRLAQLHSQAVDYNKSGVPAIVPRSLRPRNWPHFMEKVRKPQAQQYHSKNVLGQLYDVVERVKFTPEYETPFDEGILGKFELEQELLDEAEKLKEDYDARIKRIMAQHDIATEFEVYTTFVMNHNGEKRDYSFAEELGKIISAVKDQYKKLCVERAGVQDHLPRFVAAMYTVTARQVGEAVEECKQTKIVGGEEVPVRTMDPGNMPLMSFPWIFETELGKIARGNNQARVSVMQQQVMAKHKPKRPMVPLLDAADTVKTAEGVVPLGDILMLFDEGVQSEEETTTKENNLSVRMKPLNSHPVEVKDAIQEKKETKAGAVIESSGGAGGGFGTHFMEQYGVEEITISLDGPSTALDKLQDLVGGDLSD